MAQWRTAKLPKELSRKHRKRDASSLPCLNNKHRSKQSVKHRKLNLFALHNRVEDDKRHKEREVVSKVRTRVGRSNWPRGAVDIFISRDTR